MPAPWRSLIYRNVDSPFAYFDDYVPFPHMPMNTFGYDCRAPRIMGNWMVGLPAARKRPSIPEDGLPKRIATIVTYFDEFGVKQVVNGFNLSAWDDSPQPYVEVKPDDPRYADAVKQAQARLDEYHAGVRYNYCEDVLSPDIFDRAPETWPNGYRPARIDCWAKPPRSAQKFLQPAIGVPYTPFSPTIQRTRRRRGRRPEMGDRTS